MNSNLKKYKWLQGNLYQQYIVIILMTILMIIMW